MRSGALDDASLVWDPQLLGERRTKALPEGLAAGPPPFSEAQLEEPTAGGWVRLEAVRAECALAAYMEPEGVGASAVVEEMTTRPDGMALQAIEASMQQVIPLLTTNSLERRGGT